MQDIIRLKDNEFNFLVSFMSNNYGINLINKRQLVEARLYNTLLEKSMSSYSQYFSLLKQGDAKEIAILINKLTTNHTYFMREPAHFEFLKNVILPYHLNNNKLKDIRIWSAGCSSGEEAYSTVMVMKEFFGFEASKWDTSILATDISSRVLDLAKNNVYPLDALKDLDSKWIKKYFYKNSENNYELSSEIKNEVIFKQFNLMENFQYKRPFDLIFCRNVMIYFDSETKAKLINKFYDALAPGGYFFIGHSESILKEATRFKYVKPSIYQKG